MNDVVFVKGKSHELKERGMSDWFWGRAPSGRHPAVRSGRRPPSP